MGLGLPKSSSTWSMGKVVLYFQAKNKMIFSICSERETLWHDWSEQRSAMKTIPMVLCMLLVATHSFSQTPPKPENVARLTELISKSAGPYRKIAEGASGRRPTRARTYPGC